MLKTRSLRTGLVALSTCLMLAGAVSDLSAQTSLPPLSIRYVDQILERGDLQVASALISPGAVLSTPEGKFHGPEGMAAFAAGLAGSFSGLDFRIEGTHFEDDNLQIEFTLTGTQSGTYQGIPGRCAAIEVPGTVLLDLDEGMVDDQWIDYDRTEIIRQADRYNQLASSEGITCSQGSSGDGMDRVIRTQNGSDEVLTLRPPSDLDVDQVSTSDPASPCFQDPNCAPSTASTAEQDNVAVTNEQSVPVGDCIHGQACLLP
jgi:predicted ester cyclase